MVISVVIAAHNEAAVLPRCLHGLLDRAEPGEFEVVVVANGCTDATAEIARSFPGVRVLELAAAGKPAALNAGDRAVAAFPRIYLDADIVLTAPAARALAAALVEGGSLAVAPRRLLDTTGRPLLVRAYYAVNGRLPAFRDALFGRGAIALGAAGRARFAEFPDQLADDLFLDSLFRAGEKREVPAVATVVATPHRTRDLLRRLGRVRAGNAALRGTGGQVRRSRPASWLFDVVLPRPWLLPAGACYLALTVAAGWAARRPATRSGWGRDESSRLAGSRW
ncbi:glycosyltransferase [Solwaraspora sp. WMMD1047]|uniref:glycosyltransferase n=1 Tax=Solwaraspora sp. WMMD1047 TaxID=3016102 RepID=UPI0024179845|nr:glycosyltransferase [Solwaraspora sp. WMMD1047]MDG4828827.1 glycosyltransferase [Solwaraspora sp. WMMD1047]